ncbi:hypothetical protein PybrP1_005863 [[Pythium] brassicae (nom. inval.)]|nr:hypothetical protein PybrP1_005863 [[Pythium] brassicae (nom. inval.)]
MSSYPAAPHRSAAAATAASHVTLVSTLFLVGGCLLGATLDANAHIPAPWNRVSSLLGWLYFSCWSASFYPQVLLNHARRSVSGLSMDFVVLGLLGFVCYAVFNGAFYFSERVQEQYMRRNGGHRNAVEANDVLFAVHASLLTAVSLAQSFAFARDGERPHVSRATVGWTAATVAVAAVFTVGSVVAGDADGSLITTLDVLYYLSFVKLVLTLVKYIPQVVLNCQLQSTVGWAIWNVYLDIAGGVFSIAQQVLDSAATSDWTAITGDPVKLALAIVTMSMDVVLLLQHYVLYPEGASVREKQLLLP